MDATTTAADAMMTMGVHMQFALGWHRGAESGLKKTLADQSCAGAWACRVTTSAARTLRPKRRSNSQAVCEKSKARTSNARESSRSRHSPARA